MKNLTARKPFKIQQNIIMLIAMFVLLGLFSLVNPNVIKDKYMILSMVQSFAPYAVMGLGVTFVIATGGIDLSLGTVTIAAAVWLASSTLWALFLCGQLFLL